MFGSFGWIRGLAVYFLDQKERESLFLGLESVPGFFVGIAIVTVFEGCIQSGWW